MASFVTVFQRLEALGLTDVLLPFILIFAVIFAILETVHLFGDKNRNISIIVALCIALLVVVPHVTGTYPPNGDVVEIINSSIPNVSAVIIAIVMMMILIGVFGVKFNLEKGKLGGVVAILALLIVLFIFGSSAGWFARGFSWPSWLGFMNDSDTLMIIVVLLIFGLIVAFITQEEKSEEEKKKRSVGEFLKNWIGDSMEKPK